jgi:AcrR family transcriptional regulator
VNDCPVSSAHNPSSPTCLPVQVMRDLRLTHGGFYRHFGTKEDLVAEAFKAALKESGDRAIAALAQAPAGGEMQALIECVSGPDAL